MYQLAFFSQINYFFLRMKVCAFRALKMWTFYALKHRFFRYLASRVGIQGTQGTQGTQRTHGTHSTQKIWRMKARDKHRNSEDT